MERRVQREKSEKNTLLSSSHNHSIRAILKIKIKVIKDFYEQIVAKLLRTLRKKNICRTPLFWLHFMGKF